MILTLYQIYIALFMVAVAIGLFVWFRRSEAAGSARRMKSMMRRAGLDPEAIYQDSPEFRAIMNEARQRCRRCRTEGFCERWLRGIVGGGNAFCPNAQVFNVAASALGSTPEVSANRNLEEGLAT